MTTTYSVTTDLDDYAPGATVYITATGFQIGSAVTFQVQHVSGSGADGIFGTLDDDVIVLGGAGHDPWTIIDGGTGDADGLADGNILTSWYVNPDDSLDQTFLLTASGEEGTASNTFTDGKKPGVAVAASPAEANFARFDDYMVPDSTGTGVINSFVRIQDSNATPGFEAGYNSDFRPVQFNEDSSPQNNFSLRYIEVPKVTIDGVTYLVLNLDLNESNANDPNADLITLQNIKIFTASTPNLTGMDPTTRLFSGATLRYELDVDANHDGDANDVGETNYSIELTDWNSGSGTGDYQVLIPVAGDTNNLGFSGVQPSAYFYIYSEFGTKNGTGYAADGGFEEWFVVKSSSMSIDKTAEVNGGNLVTAVGDVIEYTIVVTNTGSESLTGVTVNDPYVTDLTYVSGDVNSNNVLDLLEAWTYTATHTVTAEEFYSLGGGDGHLENTATADSNETDQVSDSADVQIQEVRSLAIEKTAAVPGDTADTVGEEITYTYVVTNTGNAAIANVVVDDDNATPDDPDDDFEAEYVSGDEDDDGLLDVDEAWTFSSTRVVDQDVLDAGDDLTNVATATGDDAESDQDDATVEVEQRKGLAIEKTAAVPGDTADTVGEEITYTYVVTNTGNAAIANVVVDDDNATPDDPDDDFEAEYVSGDEDDDGLLDVDEAWTFSSTRVVDQDVLDAGDDLTNVATATGDDAESDQDDATVEVEQRKGLAIEKTAAVPGDTADTVGEEITYTYVVTNTGNAAIANVVVDDDNATPDDPDDDFEAEYVSGDEDDDGLLDVDEAWTFSSTRVVDQDVLDAGDDLTNVATATGDDAESDQDDATVEVEQRKGLAIEKTAAVPGDTADTVGEEITYTYVVTNTGNAAIANVVVDDDNATPDDPDDDFEAEYVSGDEDDDGLLDVDEAWTFSSTRVVDQDVLDAGDDLTNVATATGDDAESDQDDATVEVEQRKGLAIEKTAAVPGDTADTVGEEITYTYVVTNTGNAAIANVVVDDDNATPDDPDDDFEAEYVSGDEDDDGLLDVDEAWTFSSTRVVDQDVLDAGDDLTNVATATGDDAESDQDDATVEVEQRKGLAIEKTAAVPGDTADTVGEEITYTYVVTNTGNAAIANVVVDDDNATPDDPDDDFEAEYVSGDEDDDGLLDVDEAWTFSSTRVVDQDVLDAGDDLTNVATATGDDAESDQDDATVEVEQRKGLAIEKTAAVPGDTADTVGEEITYTYVVTNTGNAAIANVVVDDDNATPDDPDDDFEAEYVSGDEDDDGLLDVDEAWTFSSTRVVDQDVLDAGDDLTNVATATGDDAESDQDDATVEVEQLPGISINKITIYGNNFGDNLTGVIAGNSITWHYAVSNTGNAALSDVDVSDDHGTPGNPGDDFNPAYLSGDEDSDGKLDVGETWIFEEEGTAVVGTYENIGTASGTAGGIEVHDSDASSYTATAPGALVAPTGTTPLQYINGTAMTFQDYYAYQGGDIQYGVKGTKISQTNPGVFFYFTGASGDIKDGDNDNVIDTIEIKIDQSRSVSSINPFYPLNNSNIQLYKVIDNGDGSVGAGDSLVAVKPATTISVNKNTLSPNFGDLTVSFRPEAEGTMYVLSVKYSTASAVGATVGSNPGAWPTSHYDFSTYVNNVFSETYAAGVDLAPKPVSPMMLEGDEGDGAMAIRASQARAAYKAAVSWWSEQGFDVTAIKKPMVQVADLGEQDGQWLLGMTQDGRITIDDDAANHGWSLGKGKVAPDKVDLMSVMVHEVGHLLGMTHEDMGDTLEVGVRSLPALDGANYDQIGLVGTQMPQGEILFS